MIDDALPDTMGSPTLLLVDDNPAIVRALQFGLRRNGFHVLTAADGRSALDIIDSAQPIDLMLSDVVMPGGMSGVELVRAALLRRAALRVLLTTGYAYDVMESLGAKRDEFPIVAKPCTLSALIARINALLHPA